MACPSSIAAARMFLTGCAPERIAVVTSSALPRIRRSARGHREALMAKRKDSPRDRGGARREDRRRRHRSRLDGIEGLDDVLGGGFARGRLHLIQGAPGAGKTKLALLFLLAGSARNESGLLISLSETEDEVRAEAAAPFQPLGFCWCRRAGAGRRARAATRQGPSPTGRCYGPIGGRAGVSASA